MVRILKGRLHLGLTDIIQAHSVTSMPGKMQLHCMTLPRLSYLSNIIDLGQFMVEDGENSTPSVALANVAKGIIHPLFFYAMPSALSALLAPGRR